MPPRRPDATAVRRTRDRAAGADAPSPPGTMRDGALIGAARIVLTATADHAGARSRRSSSSPPHSGKPRDARSQPSDRYLRLYCATASNHAEANANAEPNVLALLSASYRCRRAAVIDQERESRITPLVAKCVAKQPRVGATPYEPPPGRSRCEVRAGSRVSPGERERAVERRS